LFCAASVAVCLINFKYDVHQFARSIANEPLRPAAWLGATEVSVGDTVDTPAALDILRFDGEPELLERSGHGTAHRMGLPADGLAALLICPDLLISPGLRLTFQDDQLSLQLRKGC
jgi:hypothetical protein